MSSLEFAEWNAFFKVEPFGSVFQDVHFATLEALIANANRPKGKAAMDPKKFMLSTPMAKQTAQELWNRLKSWALFEKGRKQKQ